ncbi:hypothetical protein [Pseudidiomarina sediminum]|uniref:hypothetical protein n=1 Tax=Pseudidiomarina sediminum TaxID=431675 RepID=UPI001C97E6F8|nr:hypothetical protein [Pseudidiomarina sediminum]MBY6063415.1 hypothetical protein [Pseudidiomarina sediminum]
MKRMLLVGVMTVVGLSGCSSKFIYDYSSIYRTEQCKKLPTKEQRFECVRKTQESHGAYEAERDRVRQDPSKDH